MAQKKEKHEESEVELSRVITPMLDMSFQILFFFVLIYQPSAMEGHMDLALPAAGEGVTKDKATASAPDIEIELPAELEVIVKTWIVGEQEKGADGAISKIIVKDNVGEKTFGSLDALKNYLEKARKGLTNPNDIKLQADGRLKYDYVVAAVDACRRAGFNNVSFAAPADLARIIPGVQ